MEWPLPERFSVLGLETLGYKKEVVYPVIVDIQDTSKPVEIDAVVRFLTCSEICVPVESSLKLTLNPGDAAPSEFNQLINKFESLVPTTKTTFTYDLAPPELYVADDKNTGTLRFHIKAKSPFVTPDAYIEGAPELAFFKPNLTLSDDRTSLIIDAAFDGINYLDHDIKNQNFTLTFADQGISFEKTTPSAFQTTALVNVAQVDGFNSAQAAGALSLPLIILFSVLGGVILNLMPCVLPVLSLKVLSFVSKGGAEKSQVRISFIATSAGILFSFLVLAGFLIVLQISGASIGWGIQFQQPLFLIALTLIVLLFACNMWGIFEITLPSWLTNMGGKTAQKNNLWGNFVTGAFATLLATPCSAPFLGTAVGFALARGPEEILIVFTALGVGLALPYLLIAIFPSVATKLPKPGPWMIVLKKILALALVATALWLGTVIWAQIGLNGAVILGGIAFCLILVLSLRHRLKTLTPLVSIALIAFAFFIPTIAKSPASETAQIDESAFWVTFEKEAIAEHIQKGQIVFVDVTAKWCLTCQVNKNFVLYQGESYAELTKDNVIAMRADWTNPSDLISNYLASFERYAIPFNVVYGPGAPNGIVLPELLDQETVVDAIRKAKG